MLWLWIQFCECNLVCLIECYGEVLYDVVLVLGRGVIVVVLYYGNWELLNQWLVLCGFIVIVYKVFDEVVGDVFLQLVCGGDNVQQVCVEGLVVCQLFKVFKDGGVIGILFDQQLKVGDGVFVFFFGIEVLIMILVNWFVECIGVIVLYGWCEWIGLDMQFVLYIELVLLMVVDLDLCIVVSVFNVGIEWIVCCDLSQYQWIYKCYMLCLLESGEVDFYVIEEYLY